MEILPGIYQLLTPFPQFTFDEAKKLRVELEAKPRVTKGLPYVLPYMIKGGGETILVDCGWNTDDAYGALETGMGEHAAHPNDISKLVITHIHPDHYGMAGRLKQLSLHGDERRAPARFADDGARLDEHARPRLARAPDTQVKGGEVIKAGPFEFEILWTPGHSPGHICLYDPNHKILLTGDHILPTITPNVSINAQTHGSPLGDYMRSLDLLVDLDVKYVLPAHEFDTKDLKKRIIEIHEHHTVRLDEMWNCVDRGGSTAWDVAGRVKWATGMLADFEPHMQSAAVGETIAHLEYLYEQGRLGKVMRGNHQHWLPV
ncbi:MAG: MBL fold metallo-hydrolase [Thermoflexaceae bacterium]|nr:MBL fold metallo-hydrolase [Thermoflexaceae bacterium]